MPIKPLHIIFAGTPGFAVPSLEAIAAHPAFSVDLVITQPDKPIGRKALITPPPVKVAAERLGIPVWQPENINTEASPSSKLTAHSFDCLVVVAYGQILSESILALPNIAPVNVHASLLPRWRGASPIQNAILAGDTETGVTVQRMVKELDAGPILAQEKISIGPRETFVELHDRLATMGAHLLVKTLLARPEPNLSPATLLASHSPPVRQAGSSNGWMKGEPQPETGITLCHKLTRATGTVDPKTMTAEEIDRRVRALVPWPGVTLLLDTDSSLKILATELHSRSGATPLSCKDHTTLYLLTVQLSGGKLMTGEAWERGRRE